MTKDMKAVCRDFEMVTGWRIPVVERAGKAMRSMAKAEPLKKKGCERDDCFPCTTRGGNCERNGSGMLFHNRPVKAAMGSVIVNGGVQLSGGKSLVNTKLVTLHFGLAQPG